jgi:hypothetical protein
MPHLGVAVHYILGDVVHEAGLRVGGLMYACNKDNVGLIGTFNIDSAVLIGMCAIDSVGLIGMCEARPTWNLASCGRITQSAMVTSAGDECIRMR